MIIDGDDYSLDLLFYHRKLKRLVAIELKIDKFKAKYKGQMELYLKWLNKYEKQEGEETPIGLILCAEASRTNWFNTESDIDGVLKAAIAHFWFIIIHPFMMAMDELPELFLTCYSLVQR